MTIAICDDEQIFIDKISTYIEKQAELHNKQCDILTCHRGDKLIDLCQKEKVDAVFLDISMPGLNGFETAEKILELRKNIVVVFVSSKEKMVYFSYEYKPFWFVPKRSNVLLENQYDGHNNLIKKEVYSNSGNGSTTQYTYDTLNRPVTQEVYDENGTLIHKETYSYVITPNYTKETATVVGGDGNPSVTTSVYYDEYGNKIKTESGTDIETYTSDYAGNITSVKSARANAESWPQTHTAEYDFMGNVTKETDELGNIIRTEYDQLGRATKIYDANGYATEFKYDNLERVIEQKVPFEEKDGTVYYSTKQMWYDNNGNVIKERTYTNASGETESYNEVIYTYDNRNRLVMTQTNDGETSNYTQNYYDAVGNLLRVYTGLTAPLTINGLDDITTGADTEYAVTEYSYNNFGQVLTVTDALGNVESNTYDTLNGILLSTTDRNCQTFNFTYDGLKNLTEKSLSDGTNAETTTYGLTGQVLTRQNSVTTISYTYNNKGQLATESDSASGTTKTYTYDANGNRTSFTLTRNGTTEINQSYTYDKLNRLISVSENGSAIAQYSYDNKGNRTQTVTNGGETTSYTYNLANMLVSQTTGEKLTEQYTYYLNGNQKSKTSNGETTTYEYDAMNRLIKENNTEYSFDDFGNRASMTSGADTVTYEYDLNNRLTESNEVSGGISKTTSYSYDNNGNQTIKTVMVTKPYSDQASKDYFISGKTNENIALFSYNCYNQLIEADTNGVVSSYSYAPDGLRHSKTVGEDTTTFVYDNSNIVEEITSDGANKYYRGFEIIKNDDNLYYIYNGQGDVTILTNNTGTTVADYSFDAYGNQSEENEVYNPFGYRGEYTDEETGFIYLRARYYDTETGRFISEDSHWNIDNMIYGDREYKENETKIPDINAINQSTNLYAYCINNPIKFVDPSGDDAIWITNVDSVYTMGHTSLLLEDENGSWYYFYWGAGHGYPIDTKQVVLEKIDNSSALESLPNLNKWLIDKSLPGVSGNNGYDSATYITGDFNASVKSARWLVDKWYAGGFYSVLTNNCMQMSTDVLMKGNYSGSWWKNILLSKAKDVVIPNIAKTVISELFGNTSFTK